MRWKRLNVSRKAKDGRAGRASNEKAPSVALAFDLAMFPKLPSPFLPFIDISCTTLAHSISGAREIDFPSAFPSALFRRAVYHAALDSEISSYIDRTRQVRRIYEARTDWESRIGSSELRRHLALFSNRLGLISVLVFSPAARKRERERGILSFFLYDIASRLLRRCLSLP